MQFIVINGTTKAGTTSLFEYLKDHPQCSGSFIKQTNYFLDKDLVDGGLVAAQKFDDQKDNYLSLFDLKPNAQICVEASPDYIHSPGTINRIKAYADKFNHSFKFITIVRNPSDRVLSWYHFGKKQGSVPLNMSFDDYLLQCKAQWSFTPGKMPFHAIRTGFYSTLFEPLIAQWPKDDLLVLDYAQLIKTPKLALAKVAQFAEIDPKFYEDYNFEAHNVSVGIRNAGLAKTRSTLRRIILPYISKPGFVRTLLQPFIGLGKATYNSVNITELKKHKLTTEQREYLDDLFAEDITKLESILQQKFDWKNGR